MVRIYYLHASIIIRVGACLYNELRKKWPYLDHFLYFMKIFNLEVMFLAQFLYDTCSDNHSRGDAYEHTSDNR